MRAHLIYKIWLRNLLVLKRNWIIHFIWTSVEPLMYLGAIGFGLGTFIQNIDGQSYLEFYYPGLLCQTAVLVSFYEATYGTFAKLKLNNYIQTISLAPIRTREILLAEALWCASKGFFAVMGVVIFASFFGLNTWTHVLSLPVIFMLSLISALFGLITTVYIKNFSGFIFSITGLLTPIILISGVFFPISTLVLPLRLISYLSPLTHSLELTRSIVSLKFEVFQIFQFFILIFLSILLYQIYIKVYTKLLSSSQS